MHVRGWMCGGSRDVYLCVANVLRLHLSPLELVTEGQQHPPRLGCSQKYLFLTQTSPSRYSSRALSSLHALSFSSFETSGDNTLYPQCSLSELAVPRFTSHNTPGFVISSGFTGKRSRVLFSSQVLNPNRCFTSFFFIFVKTEKVIYVNYDGFCLNQCKCCC